MKPAAFDYVVVDSIESAVAALAQAGGEAKLIAGGQSLVPMLNFRLLRPATLVDINRIPDLAYVREEADAVRIGALTRHHALETSPAIARHFPVLAEAMAHVAHLAIRNRGTIGGSLSHADPAAELPMMAMLLDAQLRIVAPAGARTVAARDFFKDALSVDLAADEMLTEVTLPKLPPATGWGFAEVSRRSGDFALAAVAATLTLRGGAIGAARLAMTGVAPTPRRVDAAETMLIGRSLGDATRGDVIEAVRAAAEPQTDLHASADYRRHLVGVLAGRALAAAWQRARAR
ncbi:MAG TPA: xanthine dehydrogenase family protein subunit M [Xanthobacteraceae bacterium]|nr:xanthine dehydrogenase family protein subunit M [Xanthobacteraceae bacterium]